MHYITLVAVEVDKKEAEPEIDTKIAEAVQELKEKIGQQEEGIKNVMAEINLKRMQHLSNVFARSVDAVVADKMEPYCESTENPEYLEFIDYTEDVENEYRNGIEDMIKLPNGTYIFQHSYDFRKKFTVKDGKVYQKEAGRCKHDMRTKKAKKMIVVTRKLSKHYKTIRMFAEEHRGYQYDEATGKYGYYFNPDSFWDWYMIGGRWPYAFLVRTDCTEYSIGDRDSSRTCEAPEGYMWVAAARKKDIAWDVMYSWKQETRTKRFKNLEAAFKAGKLPEEYSYAHITEDGIVSFGDIVYKKGETLEEYLARVGGGESVKYPFSPYGFLDELGWNTRNTYEYLDNKPHLVEKDSWRDELNAFIENASEETVFVSVDNHN